MNEFNNLSPIEKSLILDELNKDYMTKKRKNNDLQDNDYGKEYKKKIRINEQKIDEHLNKLLDIIRNTAESKEDFKKALLKMKEYIYEETIRSIIKKNEKDEKKMLEKYGPFEMNLSDNPHETHI